MPEFPRDTDAWRREVHGPAEQTSEGRRTLEAGGARASYRIAPLPDGRWAVSVETSLESVGGMRIPWRVLPTREECVAWFVELARDFFEREKKLTKGKQ